MTNLARRRLLLAAIAGLAAAPAAADSASTIEAKSDRALRQLFATVPGAEEIAAQAKGMLIMPDIVKGGFILGGAYGEGALRVNGETVGYYSLASASVGLQIGVQSSKQALFFMTEDALARFQRADGWEAGVDAEVTIPGDGLHAGIDTTSDPAPVIAIVFGQDGVLAGASLAGAKYSRINR
jgi:lipid-binding SYLF domain-containing protein